MDGVGAEIFGKLKQSANHVCELPLLKEFKNFPTKNPDPKLLQKPGKTAFLVKIHILIKKTNNPENLWLHIRNTRMQINQKILLLSTYMYLYVILFLSSPSNSPKRVLYTLSMRPLSFQKLPEF